MRLTWAQPEDLVAHELVQCRDEGLEVDDIETRWVAAGGDPTPAVSGASATPAPAGLRAFARQLLDELDERALAACDAGDEPDDWDEIAAALPAVPVLAAPGPQELRRRVLGAWTGRSVGCLLGKPVEKIPRQGIEEILRATGRWPLDRYFTAVGLPDEVAARWPWNRRSAPTSLEENIDGMPEDDDLNYPLLALDLLERHGTGFAADDVGALWLEALPAGRVFTAERAAYRNLLDARTAPDTARHHNPFREWIGALIRADVFGWVLPGRLADAARLAHTDARLSHTRNGLYGAQWAAALCSAALASSTVDEVLDAAATVVPPRSRLAAAIAFGRNAARAGGDLADGIDRLHARYGELHWVHVLNNAATISFALAYGQGDLVRSIAAAVTTGWDTDSVGATVGSVVGALRGPEGIPTSWSEPIDGRIATSLPGPAERRIDDLVRRTLALQAAIGSPA